MRIFNVTKGVKGFKTLDNATFRENHIIGEEAKERVRILKFWKKYGLEATKEAYGVRRSTLYLWQKKLKSSKGRLDGLNSKSRRPKSVRKRIVDYRVEEEIIKLREEHPRLGKEKISVLLEDFCKQNDIKYQFKSSTVGRILKDLKERSLLPTYKKTSFYAKTNNLIERKIVKQKKLRRKDHQVNDGLFQIDTIVKFHNGIRRYIITAICEKVDFSFAFGYKNLNSLNAKDFLDKLISVSPIEIKYVQTDNGLEFEKHFREHLKDLNIPHFHNYPRCPKMNAFVERFNRTAQEEFIDFNLNTLSFDLSIFNRKLIDWLLWYNCKRPHHSLGLLSPLQYIIETDYLKLGEGKSNMLWTNTIT